MTTFRPFLASAALAAALTLGAPFASAQTVDGNDNVKFGPAAMAGGNDQGSVGVAVGRSAGYNGFNTGAFPGASGHVRIGRSAGINSRFSGIGDVVIGHWASSNVNNGNMPSLAEKMLEGENVVIGMEAAYAGPFSTGNVVLGARAGYRAQLGGSSLGGVNNVYLGAGAGSERYGEATVALGWQAGSDVSGVNSVLIGNNVGRKEAPGTLDDKLVVSSEYPYDAGQAVVPLLYGSFSDGALGVNTRKIGSGYALSVGGKLRAEEVVVELQGDWPDYVFEKGYELPSLRETEAYVSEHGRLPGMPSAAEVAERGIEVGAMEAKLLEKVEELTLHLIRLEKRNAELERRLAELERGAPERFEENRNVEENAEDR